MASSAGVATGAGTRVDVTMKLSQLQNMVKRDPGGYLEDYQAQVRRLESECGILLLSSSTERPSSNLIELIQFAAAVSSSSYKGKEADRIATMLMNLLIGKQQGVGSATPNVSLNSMPTAALQLHRDVRKACVSALILMRNKGAVEPLRLFELFFRLMVVVPDKALRELLYSHMVHDIRNMNAKGKRNDAVNRSVQSLLHRVVVSPESASSTAESSASTSAAKLATDIVCDLYRRQVWVDDRAVAIVASAAVHTNMTAACRAMRFFLNIEEKMALDQQRQQDDEWQASNHINLHKHSRKTSSRKRRVEKQLKNRRKAQLKKERAEWMEMGYDEGVEVSKKLYPAIELLRDPQGLAEVVLKRLKSTNSSYKYEVKLLMMNFVTRLVGNHELLLLNLYPFLQRYMGGHQRDVTAVLAYSVQACHEYVPPEEVYGILKTIAHNFISERCSGEQMAVGINAARAICSRVPSALSIEESRDSKSTVMDVEAYVRDLAAYANHRDRSVSIAGKSWTNFIREVYPSLLQGKDRGMKGSALHRSGQKPLRYGQQKVATGVEGADLLVEYEAKRAEHQLRQRKDDDDDGIVDEEDEGIRAERMNDELEEVDMDSDDESAPELVLLQRSEEKVETKEAAGTDESISSEPVVDLSKMTQEEREKLKQDVSATRVFTATDFERMRKLVEREKRAKRDPRAAARRKRAIAQGKEFEELSDDGSDSDSEDERLNISGAVTPGDIMAEAKRRRLSRAEKLEQIIAGRTKFESKDRDGGSTNIEKTRKKNFLMTKFSHATRSKRGRKATAKAGKSKQFAGSHDAKKRRRKF